MTFRSALFVFTLIFASTVHAKSVENSSKKFFNQKNITEWHSQIKSRELTFAILLIPELGNTVRIQINQDELTFNAFATFDDESKPLIIVNQGLLNHSSMTKPLLDLFLCHELGHLSGGEPKLIRRNGKVSWSSVEGQADYYATYICMDRLGYDEKTILSESLNFTNLIAQLKGTSIQPSLRTPDQHRVDRVLQSHPNPQCRLDTLVAGLNKSPRPLCWFIFKEVN